jgi:hypothetical protein
MHHLGFTQEWVDWVATLLAMASTRILINAAIGMKICHACGLRQGDPYPRCFSCL